MIQNLAQSPLDADDEMITSFENPNYHLNCDDALNSNIPTPTTPDSVQYYNEHLYGEINLTASFTTSSNTTTNTNMKTTTTTTDTVDSGGKRRKNYVNLDLKYMGNDLKGEVESGDKNRRSCSSQNVNIDESSEGHQQQVDNDTDRNESDSEEDEREGEGRIGILHNESLQSEEEGEGIEDICRIGILHNESLQSEEEGEDEEVVGILHDERVLHDDSLQSARYSTKTSTFLAYYASLERATQSSPNRAAAASVRPPNRAASLRETSSKEDSNADNVSKAPSKHRLSSFADKKCINSPDSNDSGIQADEPNVLKSTSAECLQSTVSHLGHELTTTKLDSAACGEQVKDVKRRTLPPGWEKHDDDDGAYYWHIKSGTIQRKTPTRAQRPLSVTSDLSLNSELVTLNSPTSPTTPVNSTVGLDQDHLQEFEGHAFKYASESLKTVCTPSEENNPTTMYEKKSVNPIRFAVRSLGWVPIAEQDLTTDRSSKAVNRCIMDLSMGRNDINDPVGRWGDGKDLFMHLDNHYLILVDPQDMTVLNKQMIQSIRVWGVGRDNGRDFAYVARDRLSRKYMCQVFRCDTPARHIANALRDICRKLMTERRLCGAERYDTAGDGAANKASPRPNNLPNLEKPNEHNGQKITFQSLYKKTYFPTPMEEPKKVLRGYYLGTIPVSTPGGIDMLNTAMEVIYHQTPPSQWHFCNIAVAPSTITVTDHGNPDVLIAECRVRFLSFMGIAMNNVKLCSFIMHTAEDTYNAHVFHCEPSAGALCKTIEAACKLRYQKCLDAHPQTTDLSRHHEERVRNDDVTGT